MVTATDPRRLTRGREQRFDFRSRQKVNQSFVTALGRYRQDALDMSAVRRFLNRHESEE